MKDKLGDYQTPPALAAMVMRRIAPLGPWTRMIEPTCGRGALITAANVPEIRAFDIQQHYVDHCKSALPQHANYIQVANALKVDYSTIQWRTSGPLLVFANPPWVSVGRSRKRARESSMVDLSTQIILEIVCYAMKLNVPVTFAILCKTSTSREILQSIPVPLVEAFTCEINAIEHFNVQVCACLCVFVVDAARPAIYRYGVYEDLFAPTPVRHQGWVMGVFVNDVDTYELCRGIDGICHLEWFRGTAKSNNIGATQVRLIRSTDAYHNNPPSTPMLINENIAPQYKAPYKIVISCMHKDFRFRLYFGVFMIPDDTCCFLPLANYEEAEACLMLLSSSLCMCFLYAMCFIDAKRPVTTALLQRINFGELARRVESVENSTALTKLRKIVS